MAKKKRASNAVSNAARQASYRARHLHNPDSVDSERLNMVVPVSTKRALERLARHYGVTQRGMLERLVREAETAVLDGLKSREQDEYYDEKREKGG